MTNFGTSLIVADDSASIDAFGRWRMSSPQTIFDSKQLADKQVLFWDESLSAGTSSTFNTNQASTTLAVANLAAGTATRQTRRRFNYQPGKSQLILMTFVLGAAATGITRRVGLFDDNNGLFIEQTSSGQSFVRRTYTSGAPVNNSVAQSSWNIDKMNGTGTSGIMLDFSKTQILFMDFEWLGVGRVRMGFVVDGKVYYAHEFLNANSLSLVYMSTPNLPLRYQIVNSGAGAALSLVHICSTVISEGGISDTGYPFGVSRGTTAMTTLNSGALFPLISIRLRSTYLQSTVKKIRYSIACTSTTAYNAYLIVNPTVAGVALGFTAITNSSVEADAVSLNTTTVTGGTIIDVNTSLATNESSLSGSTPDDFALGSSIAGVSDVLVLAVQRITGAAETFYGSINWKDQQ